MASAPQFLLTPQQQELLFAALNAHRPGNTSNNPATTTAPGDLTISPTPLDASPAAATKSIDPSTSGIFSDSSFLDYDYSFDGADSGLDFSLHNADQSGFPGGGDGIVEKAESAPSSADNDSPDKRSHPDGSDGEASAAKRRESTEKIPKKPGRKPLTSEPSSKRKAQNRAAQRAFRERKEKHLKDLETKVAELEKASEDANNENGILRAQVEKMTVELNEYKKRLALVATERAPLPAAKRRPFGDPIFNNINDVNFQFEFPKFGKLPGPHPSVANGAPLNTVAALQQPTPLDAISPTTDLSGNTPATTVSSLNSPRDAVSNNNPLLQTKSKDDLSKLSSVFSPSLTNANLANATRVSMDSTATSSPSASSNTNTAPSSSCGTSPEPCNNQSPMGAKPVDTMATIGEEQTPVFANTTSHEDNSQFANINLDDMSWLGTQNVSFDPQLFGDYREPQDNILNNGGFDDSFFNDALDIDFSTPFNMAPSPILHKTSLIEQIDAAKDGEFSSSSLKSMPPTVPNHPGTLLTCNKIWERLQNCPKVQNGDFDLDGLCSDLQKKAKCSGSGAVVDEHDFKVVMKKYLGKSEDSNCVKDLASEIAAKK